MSAFHEVRFPVQLALGAIGGLERKTEVITLSSGREVRTSPWMKARRRWDVGGAINDLSKLQELVAFFEARAGQLYGFRFRDPLDHSSAAPGESIGFDDQVLGVGDGQSKTFQLRKSHAVDWRDIEKPVDGTVIVGVDGTERESGWRTDFSSGLVTFETAPDEGQIVSAGFEFDCPVRFETDQIQAVIEAFGAGRLVSIGLVELLRANP